MDSHEQGKGLSILMNHEQNRKKDNNFHLVPKIFQEAVMPYPHESIYQSDLNLYSFLKSQESF